MCINTHPLAYSLIGTAMSGRRWNAETSYRYGFNGKEGVKEFSVDEGSYDFGARMYDSRLGRWRSVDRSHSSYPHISAYSFTGDNTILFVDYDGNDYGVYIDHDKKTIFIKLTFYATKADAKEAQEAVKHWVNSSGNFQYQFEEDGQTISYAIIYEPIVIQTKDYSERDERYFEDESGEANTYMVTNEVLNGDHGYTEEEPGQGKGASRVTVVIGKQRPRKTGSHEVGHTLGILHWAKSLMKAGPSRTDSDVKITQGNMSKVLSRIGIGKQIGSGGMDFQKEKSESTAKGKIQETIGIATTNFSEGQVIEN